MKWHQLLSTERQSSREQHPAPPTRHTRSAFNRDYGRILYSSAFRRLQDKTQVFPLGRNDYVRTRMTHSLEVANVGRTLALRLCDIASARACDAAPEPDALVDIVATVCLAHDIGNPPFGHSGEDAINAALKGTRFESFQFEGNAQGFRLLTRTCDPIANHGLDLTAATLGAFAKYPCSATTKHGFYKKFGIMPDEMPIFSEVARLCGLPALDTAGGVWARHPLALLMEAADDISYLIADVEDAYFSKIIGYDDCIAQLASMDALYDAKKHAHKSDPRAQANHVHMARAIAVGACIDRVSRVLSDHYDAIMDGRFTGSLMAHTDYSAKYDAVKDFSVKNIYNHESVTRIEIAGFAVLKGLLELFMEWVTSPQSSLGRKIGDILHAPPTTDEYERFLHVIDYLSGMTDSYALHTYTTLMGRTPL